MRSIVISVIDCINVKGRTRGPSWDDDGGWHRRFTRVISGEVNGQVAARIGTGDGGRGGRRASGFRDRKISNRERKGWKHRYRTLNPNCVGHRISITVGAGRKVDGERAAGDVYRREGVPVGPIRGKLARCIALVDDG